MTCEIETAVFKRPEGKYIVGTRKPQQTPEQALEEFLEVDLAVGEAIAKGKLVPIKKESIGKRFPIEVITYGSPEEQ